MDNKTNASDIPLSLSISFACFLSIVHQLKLYSCISVCIWVLFRGGRIIIAFLIAVIRYNNIIIPAILNHP